MLSGLKYKLSGSGPVIVLLHGFCESKELWNDFHESLNVDYTILTPDLTGHGESTLNVNSLSIEYFADRIENLLQELGIEECILIGHSLGGYVTLAFAEKYPEYLTGFGLFHSTAFADTEDKKENRNKTIQFIEKNGVDAFADSFVEPLFFMRNRQMLQAEISLMKETTRKTSKDTVIQTTLAMRDRKERLEVLKTANVPVLFIVGKEDGPVPLEKSLQQCYLPANSTVHFLSDCGHMGMFERKEETISFVRQFAQYLNF